jgi:alanine-synthesizing transaminase
MFASRTNWRFEPNRLTQTIEERRRKGLPILDLTESNPTRCGFDYDAQRILAALSDPRSLSYEPDPRGFLKAREAVAAYYAERGATVEHDQIFLVTSTSEAYSYVFRLLADTGDNLLAPSPSYPLFDFLGQLNDLELIPYSLDYDHGWRIHVANLEEQTTPRTRAILVVHPNNPTGSFVHAGEGDSLIELCRKHQLALVADEVFADYALESEDARRGSTHRVTTHAAENRALTFTLSGLSKISALPQMKLAWIVVNGPQDMLRDALTRLEVIADTYLSMSAPLAYALPALLETRREIQPLILERVRANVGQLDEVLSHGSAVSRLEVEGGWYAVLKLPVTRTDEDWAIEILREDGVLTHPGHFYDFPAEGFLVVSLLPVPEVFTQGVRAIVDRVARNA